MVQYGVEIFASKMTLYSSLVSVFGSNARPIYRVKNECSSVVTDINELLKYHVFDVFYCISNAKL